MLDVSSSLQSFGQLVKVLLIFLFVLVLTAATAKWIANYQKGVGINRNIKAIETFRISSNKYIQIVQVGTRYFLLAVGKDSVSLLAELTEDQLPQACGQGGTTSPEGRKGQFRDILEKVKKKFP